MPTWSKGGLALPHWLKKRVVRMELLRVVPPSLRRALGTFQLLVKSQHKR